MKTTTVSKISIALLLIASTYFALNAFNLKSGISDLKAEVIDLKAEVADLRAEVNDINIITNEAKVKGVK
ncbi:hypothetical protein ES704_01392 [subsurface metagenome]|jgi:cell division protein FtsL